MGLNFLRGLRPESTQSLGGRYQVVEQLGEGGFGQTFLAQDHHLPGHPYCVIKQLKPQVQSDQQLQVARRLFDTEAQALYQLGSHPQIPRLLAHFEDKQEFYLAQELIEGHALEDELKRAVPWSDSQVIAFLDDILSTLAFVHEQRVIHRDLKPSNLIRRDHDNRIVLIDFGAVKQVSTQTAVSPASVSHTISIGTRGYMPNEQVAGRPQFSSDVYAVGMIAIQALTGQHPATIEPYPQTHELAGELDWHAGAAQSHSNLVTLLDYMVRYDFRSRYATATEALSALRTAFPNLSQSIPPVANANSESSQQPISSPQPQPNSGLSQPSELGNAPQPSPSRMQTVAAGRRPSATTATRGTFATQTTSKVSQSQTPQKLTLLTGLGIGTLLVLGLLIWRACAPSPTVETATPTPEATRSEPTVEPDDSLPQETPSPEPVAESVDPPSAETDPETEPLDPPEEPNPVAPDPVEPDPVEPPGSATAPTPAAAQATIANFYNHVSNQDWDTARSLFGEALAPQFDPNFFGQFQRVTVENLRVINQTDGSVGLVGQNTYVYPDGSTQREERNYTVQMVDGQPRIVASSFIRVIQSRGN